MKKFLVLASVAVMISAFANATIRRVGFFGPLIPNQDYATFSTAYTAATSGDTILVFPGIVNITQTFAKKLIVIGPGDFLNPASTPAGNAQMQAATGVATINSITFAAGSDGSVVTGFEGGSFDVRTSNITIRRNRDILVYISYVQLTYSNLQILENYRVNVSNGNVNGSSISNLNVSNNLMYAFITSSGNSYSGSISNNVWVFDNTQNAGQANGGNTTMSNTNALDLGGGSYLFQNNILVSNTSLSAANNTNYYTIANGGNSVFNYNMALETSTPTNFGVGVGNVITPIASASSIFNAFPLIGSASADSRYKLGASSPAATVGQGGKPIGMYGGTAPYKASLIPSIPSIYKLSSAQGNNPSGNSITITLSTRGNN